MKQLIIACIFFLTPVLINAQQWPFELWHDGKIVLLQGDTLRGLVKYDMQQDLVQYSIEEKKVEAFTARKILFFEIFDTSVHRYREFFALPFNTVGGYRSPIFFELLAEGKMTLLCREALELRTYSSPYYMGSYSRQVLVNKFFFLDAKGEIIQFTGKKSDLFDRMGSQADEVEKYARSNRLSYEEKYELAKIVLYYNSLAGK